MLNSTWFWASELVFLCIIHLQERKHHFFAAKEVSKSLGLYACTAKQELQEGYKRGVARFFCFYAGLRLHCAMVATNFHSYLTYHRKNFVETGAQSPRDCRRLYRFTLSLPLIQRTMPISPTRCFKKNGNGTKLCFFILFMFLLQTYFSSIIFIRPRTEEEEGYTQRWRGRFCCWWWGRRGGWWGFRSQRWRGGAETEKEVPLSWRWTVFLNTSEIVRHLMRLLIEY